MVRGLCFAGWRALTEGAMVSRPYASCPHEPMPTAPPAPHVVFCLTGDVRRNARAVRQTATLAAMGVCVTALSVAEDPPGADAALAPGVGHRVLDRPRGRGPRFFLAVHRAVARALAEVTSEGDAPATVLHASDLYTLPACLLAARRLRRRGARVRVVFDSRESYPDTPAVAGRPLVRLGWRIVERTCAPRADAVLTVSDALAEVLVARLPLRTYPLVLVNAAAAHVGPPRDLRAAAGLTSETRVVVHTGALRDGRGLDTLVRAVARLRTDLRAPVALVLLGSGPLADGLLALARESGADVRIVPAVAPAEVPAWTASADVAAVTLDGASVNVRVSLPNKLFEALAGGVPIVASDLPALRSVVGTHGCGLLVPPGDPAALAGALARLLTDTVLHAHCAAGARAAQSAAAPERQAERLAALYRRLLTP